MGFIQFRTNLLLDLFSVLYILKKEKKYKICGHFFGGGVTECFSLEASIR